MTGLALTSSTSVVSAQQLLPENSTEPVSENDSLDPEIINNILPGEDNFSDEETLYNSDENNDYTPYELPAAANEQDITNINEAASDDYEHSGVGEVYLKESKETEQNEIQTNKNAASSEGSSEEQIILNDGWNDIDGNILYYKNNEPYTGWVYEKGSFYYTFEGVKYIGWKNLGKKEGEKTPHWSYFGEDGRLRTGWVQLGQGTANPDGNAAKHWSYFGDNGWLRTGWVQLGLGTANPDGNAAKHWSYFGDNGWLRTGWVQLGQGTANPDGNAAKHWSYFGDNGWLRTGWVQLGQGTANPDGNAAKHWSYFGDNGWLRTGWVQLGQGTANPDGNAAKHWSYFGNNGWLRTGWVRLGKGTSEPDGNSTPHLSNFGTNGWLKTGTANISGMKCTFNDSGWLRLYETVTPHYKQYAYGYGTGCGGVSLFMAMRYKGYLTGWTLQKFMNTMPYSSDGNPNNGFVGSPYNYKLTPQNRGIYPAALAKWGSQYGKVIDISGCTVDYMMNEVLNNNPVLALATWNLSDYPITQYSWGKYRDDNHHFFVLVGYDYDHDQYKVMDALVNTGDGSKWVTGASFRKVWNGIKGAVVVR